MKYLVILLLCPLVLSPILADDIVNKPSVDRETYVDVDITFAGAEKATKRLSEALEDFTKVIEKSLEGDKITTTDREHIEKIINSLTILGKNLDGTIERSRNPVNAIVKDTADAISSKLQESRKQLIDPFIAQMKFGLIFVGILIVLVLFGAISILLFKLTSLTHHVTDTLDNLSESLDDIPKSINKSIELLETKYIDRKDQQE